MNNQNKREPKGHAPGRMGKSGFAGGERGTGDGLRHIPLRDEIVAIDAEILDLLKRRFNLLEKMKRNGKIEASDEKFIREAWQTAVARVSKDASLSGKFFTLMREISFLPRPAPDQTQEEGKTPLSARREAFNLAPPRKPAQISMCAPLDTDSCIAWTYLAAAAGQALEIGPCAQSDPLVDFIKAVDQVGGAVSREGPNVLTRAFAPLSAPDKVIYLGDSELNFYLFLAHYLGRPSRAKFTGASVLKLADFSELGRALPALGARLVHVVPKNYGLPARVECSGILPPAFVYPPELPAKFAFALLLAAPFYEAPFAVDLANHPEQDKIMARILPIYEQCGVTFKLDDWSINTEPGGILIPKKPQICGDIILSPYLLGLVEPLAGEATLDASWPGLPECQALARIMASMGINWRLGKTELVASRQQPLSDFELAKATPEDLRGLAPEHSPLLISLATCAALANGHGSLPDLFARDPITQDFLNAAGAEITDKNQLVAVASTQTPVWNAPAPAWAMALAIAACARPGRQGFQLGNPGIMTSLWPGFWAFYNGLPSPQNKMTDKKDEPPPKSRRRILTNVVAEPPKIEEEDWDMY